MISEVTNTEHYAGGNASPVAPREYAIPFRFDHESWIQLLIAPPLPAGTDFHYTFSEPRSEWLTGMGRLIVTTDLTNRTLTIKRNAPAEQTLDLVPNAPLPAQALERTLDHMVMAIQDRVVVNHDGLERSFLRQENGGIKLGDIHGNLGGENSITLQASRSADENIAAGRGSIVIGDSSAAADGVLSIGHGNAVSSSGGHSTVVGGGNMVEQIGNLVFGNTNYTSGSYSIIHGFSNYSDGNDTISLGNNNFSAGSRVISIGIENIQLGDSDFNITTGHYNKTNGRENVIIGKHNATSDQSILIGNDNRAFNYLNAAFGNSNTGLGYETTICGHHNTTYDKNSNALGIRNACRGNFTLAAGIQNEVRGEQASAFGYKNSVINNTNLSSACGANNLISSQNSAHAFGFHNEISGNYSSAIGLSNKVTGHQSAAFGYQLTLGASNVTEIGNRGTTYTARVRANANSGAVSLSYAQSTTPPLPSPAAYGAEVSGDLPQTMLSFRVNGSTFCIDINIGGTVRTISLAIP